MLVHVYLQQNNAVIGYFITWLYNNDINTTATSVSTTREQHVINMAVPRGSVSRRNLQLYLKKYLAFSGLTFLKLIQVVYIGTQSFILTASYTVLPKLKKKNGRYCSIYLWLLMARGRREACLYRRSWIRWLPVICIATRKCNLFIIGTNSHDKLTKRIIMLSGHYLFQFNWKVTQI